MIRVILKWLILVPLAIVMIIFAVANRESVSVSLDPFSSVPPAVAVRLPLFFLILIVLMLGVFLGGIAAWLGQGKWRKAARRLESELRNVHADAEAWKRRATDHNPPASVTALAYRPPPAA